MELFDLHCDSVNKCMGNAILFKDTALKRCNKDVFKNQSQCFALWTDDEKDENECEKRRIKLFEKYESLLSKIEEADITPYLTIENSKGINDVDFWKEKGVIIASLTWNAENELACGSGCKSGGIKEKGRRLIKEYEKNQIVLDVSHLNFTSFKEVCKISDMPFVASHSCCYSLYRHKRNLKDFQIREIISRGGLIGLCFYPPFLKNEDVFEAVYENITHICYLDGENSLAFGSDFDGGKMNNQLKNSLDMEKLLSYLLKKGLSYDLVSKIFYKNSQNFFNNVLH